jgi:hypothetical protein
MVTAQNAFVEGYWNVTPAFKVIDFPSQEQMRVEMEDGRIILLPLDRFPSIQQLSMQQRQQWYRYGNGFSFEDSDEVFHIEQILGNYNLYQHEA